NEICGVLLVFVNKVAFLPPQPPPQPRPQPPPQLRQLRQPPGNATMTSFKIAD
ncbi:unnamed protein product, partial [Rotaria sp. Silwood2]